MIIRVADNIISPIGLTSEENLNGVLAGKTRLRLHEGLYGLPEAFVGSVIDREIVDRLFADKHPEKADTDLTFFEKLCIVSASSALEQTDIDASANDVIFVFSTTKGNVELLQQSLDNPEAYIGQSAVKIARFFGNKSTPIVASNACISGICAQIAAVRTLLSGEASTAVVIGADTLSRFIISGFQSFKALSPEPCRPYDSGRLGLNLGEAAGTLILQRVESCTENDWVYTSSAINNDANHISGPSRTGEGAYRVLSTLLKSVDPGELAFVNTHGTATMYNDEMESIALHRAGLSATPVAGLKGYYGHTLGAAGVIETIISMRAADADTIPATRGYVAQGTTYSVNVSDSPRPASGKKCFIKLLSGFGGSNAGIAYRKGGAQ